MALLPKRKATEVQAPQTPTVPVQATTSTNTIPKVKIPTFVPVKTTKPVQIAQVTEEDTELDTIPFIEGLDIEEKLNRRERRRMNRIGKVTKKDESLVQKIEGSLLTKLAKKYPHNLEIVAERDMRVQPKKVNGAKPAKKGK